jgi:hypothetical protein
LYLREDNFGQGPNSQSLFFPKIGAGKHVVPSAETKGPSSSIPTHLN